MAKKVEEFSNLLLLHIKDGLKINSKKYPNFPATGIGTRFWLAQLKAGWMVKGKNICGWCGLDFEVLWDLIWVRAWASDFVLGQVSNLFFPLFLCT